MTIEIDRLVMSILGSLEVVHLLLTNFHHIRDFDYCEGAAVLTIS
jgi:hypothetical protein